MPGLCGAAVEQSVATSIFSPFFQASAGAFLIYRSSRPVLGRNHPTITDANHGMQVLSRFASTTEPPHPAEGYDKLITLTLEQQPPSGYTKQDVLAILQRLRDAPPVRVNAHGTQGTTQPHRNQRGGSSRYSRGRGRGRGHNRARRGFPLGNRSEYRNGHGPG